MRHPFLRFERVHCRGERCSPLPVCFARKLSRKMRCCAKLAGDQWSPLHMQQARACRGPRGGSTGHPSQECGAQFSVTVMVPILVLSTVVLPNAPSRDSEAVALPSCRALSVLYYGSYAGADEAFLRLGREVKERGLTPAGDPRVLGIVAPYTGREIETKRYCSRLVLPVEGEAEPSFPV